MLNPRPRSGGALTRKDPVMKPISLTVVALALVLSAAPTFAQCNFYDHNGSTMRVYQRGNSFTITYQNPRNVLQRAGVRSGTVLFSGTRRGDRIEGNAKRFSRFCPRAPLEYYVAGRINEHGIRLTGSREVYERCEPTGRTAYDDLYFSWLGC